MNKTNNMKIGKGSSRQTAKLTAQLRKELHRIPMPAKNWEDKIYAQAIATNTKDKQVANSEASNTLAPWLGGLLNNLSDNLARPFIATAVAASFLALVLFLQPLNSLYSQLTADSYAQNVAYLEEMLAYDPVLDAAPDAPITDILPEAYLVDEAFFTGN